MEFVEKIRKLLESPKIHSQAKLAQLAALDQTAISKMIKTGRKPEPLTCLLFAAISDGDDRDFWTANCGLSRLHLSQLAIALTDKPLATSDDEWQRRLELILANGASGEIDIVKTVLETAAHHAGNAREGSTHDLSLDKPSASTKRVRTRE